MREKFNKSTPFYPPVARTADRTPPQPFHIIVFSDKGELRQNTYLNSISANLCVLEITSGQIFVSLQVHLQNL